jgi:phage gp36-like protein
LASRKKTEKNNPLVALAHRNKLSKQDIYKALHITASTYQSYIMNPYIMPLHRLIPLSGLFGISVEELVYLLIRNKPILHKEHKAYIGSLIDKHKD